MNEIIKLIVEILTFITLVIVSIILMAHHKKIDTYIENKLRKIFNVEKHKELIEETRKP